MRDEVTKELGKPETNQRRDKKRRGPITDPISKGED